MSNLLKPLSCWSAGRDDFIREVSRRLVLYLSNGDMWRSLYIVLGRSWRQSPLPAALQNAVTIGVIVNGLLSFLQQTHNRSVHDNYTLQHTHSEVSNAFFLFLIFSKQRSNFQRKLYSRMYKEFVDCSKDSLEYFRKLCKQSHSIKTLDTSCSGLESPQKYLPFCYLNFINQ